MPDTPPSLLIRLRDAGDQRSWQQFFDQYWRLIYHFARACGLKSDDAQDVLQEVVTDVFKAMPNFEYDRSKGTFRGYLRTVTQRKVISLLERRKARPVVSLHQGDDGNGHQQLHDPAGPDAEEVWEINWRRNLMQVSLARVAKEVEPKTFQAFQLTALEGWTPASAAEFLKLSVSSVYVAKYRIIERLRYWVEKETKEDDQP